MGHMFEEVTHTHTAGSLRADEEGLCRRDVEEQARVTHVHIYDAVCKVGVAENTETHFRGGYIPAIQRSALAAVRV